MTSQSRHREVLERFLPPGTEEWVCDYITRHNICLRISRRRHTKLGDYRWPQPRHPFHEISVNGDLNPYYFFWVFLHEVAHHAVHLAGTKSLPHGPAWQRTYAQLLQAHCHQFPAEVQPLIERYAGTLPLRPAAARAVEEAFRPYDKDYRPDHASSRLDDLPAGSCFRLKSSPRILFQSIEKRRTRWLCTDLATKRRYAVAGRAEVIPEKSPAQP